jgi:magnesium-protoporphyrin IX monomethyl ester (oxidative) cyclase
MSNNSPDDPPQADVVLVLMPYAATERPSIALGILSAGLQQHQISCRTLYANLTFANEIGLGSYTTIESMEQELQVGEWTFARAAFPEFYSDEASYLELLENVGEQDKQMLRRVRRDAGAFVDRVARDVLTSRPRILGVSSTFQQNCASLALLRRVRELAPQVTTVIGGANCEAEMGRAAKQSFAFIDVVVSGEADELFPGLCQEILDGGRIEGGFRTHTGSTGSEARDGRSAKHDLPLLPSPATGERHEAPRAVVRDLDALPIPDYDEYFHALHTSPLAAHIAPGLLVETSRGCWWGQKHHCTFCGLNGLGMTYRTKSPQRVVDEFGALAARYGIRKFEVVDNILDMGHLTTVLPKLSNLARPYSIFYETKANLKREHVQGLSEAGVRWIQPGLETMHGELIKLLDKGNSAMINVQLLKWCREMGVRVSWNFLAGIPGEREEWTSEMLEWLALISHLEPPQGLVRIRFDRFSLYHESPEKYGLSLVPHRVYSHIYPVAPELLHDFVYFFEDASTLDDKSPGGSSQAARHDSPAQAELRRHVTEWKKAFWYSLTPILSMSDDGATLKILDTRTCATQRRHEIRGLSRDIYLLCDRAHGTTEIVRTLNVGRVVPVSPAEVSDAIGELTSARLVLAIEGKVLSLAVRGSIPRLQSGTDFPGGHRQLTPILT